MSNDCRILECAQKLFSRFGLKSVTMDDIAREIGISKKTIYQSYSDKDKLVHAYLEREKAEQITMMEEITKSSKNAVEEILNAMQFMGKTFSRINPNLFYDMNKYHHESWNLFKAFKEDYLMKYVIRNLEKGKEEGLYRADINNKTLARLRLEQIEMAMNPSIFPPDKFNHVDVQIQLLDHFLHGIATLKGHKLINKYRQIDEE
ncbi:MAG: TetR/AcrR family transcriptional regulator [Bacteroidota bacterium]